jgi:hypothetical protein
MDPIVHDELAKLKANPIRSDYEWEVLKDIDAWAIVNKLDRVLSQKEQIQAYWEERLS